MKYSFVQPNQGFKKDVPNKLRNYKEKASLERPVSFGNAEIMQSSLFKMMSVKANVEVEGGGMLSTPLHPRPSLRVH